MNKFGEILPVPPRSEIPPVPPRSLGVRIATAAVVVVLVLGFLALFGIGAWTLLFLGSLG